MPVCGRGGCRRQIDPIDDAGLGSCDDNPGREASKARAGYIDAVRASRLVTRDVFRG